MKKRAIQKLFLYKYRFIIGYTVLALTFLIFIAIMPAVSPDGLSASEKESVVSSYNMHFSSITSGDLVDLPYHILQKISILLFGMNNYAIKLPSIIVAAILGVLFVLLLNRWFKNNVALLASILTVLSIPFLYLAGSGTPDIMLVFWPTILLWLGSKIQGEKRPDPRYCFVFAMILLLSIFTPHMVFLDLIIVLYAFINPHLRFTIKTLPKIPLVVGIVIVSVGVLALAINIFSKAEILQELLFSKNFLVSSSYFGNFKLAFAPMFSWGSTIEGVYLTPIIGLPMLFIGGIGLVVSAKGFRATRNALAILIIIFMMILSGFNPNAIDLVILPLAMITAQGLKTIIEKWYGLFPENPFARVFGILPISAFIIIIIVSAMSNFIFGYRYTPAVASNFDNDLELVIRNLEKDTSLLARRETTEKAFFEVYEDRTHNVEVVDSDAAASFDKLAVFGDDRNSENNPVKIDSRRWYLAQIICSSKSNNSDRIYLYNRVK